jgi:hypothetical protein
MIYALIKKSLFKEAKELAKEANFPKEIVWEIFKEHADKLF